MQLHVKKCIHLMVILLALIETFTGAVIDCVIYTIFYTSDADYNGSPTFSCYFTAYLLPTKHFYRLIIVLYVPILYLWRSRGVGRIAEGSSDVSLGNLHGCSGVLEVISASFPCQVLPSTAGWLWHWLRFLQSTNTDVPVANNLDGGCKWQSLTKPGWNEDWKSWETLIHYSGQRHNSVIKQYNTRVSCSYAYLPFA